MSHKKKQHSYAEGFIPRSEDYICNNMDGNGSTTVKRLVKILCNKQSIQKRNHRGSVLKISSTNKMTLLQGTGPVTSRQLPIKALATDKLYDFRRRSPNSWVRPDQPVKYQLPTIKKSSLSRQIQCPLPKENISPKTTRNRDPSKCYNRSLSQKSLLKGQTSTSENANLEHKKGLLKKITNPTNKPVSRKTIGANLALPDDSNYEKIVSFVQDLKTSIAPARQISITGEQSATCRNSDAHKCEILIGSKREVKVKRITFYDKGRAAALNNNNNTSELRPLSITSRQCGRNRLVNCWTHESKEADEEFDFSVIRQKLHIQKGERLSLFTSLKAHTREMELKFSLRDPCFIIDPLTLLI